ncbi:MFS transporter [Brenneria populi subsp. brevivirga]|uniref:MFS transporter n=1 Tax=Brenneria populi TaxID=1505588 RepID=UPI002E174743|nr:MFS transporter [Brenneria populi subsp. brevivirga]
MSDKKFLPLIVAFITMLIVGTDLFVVSPLLSMIAESLNVSVGEAGISVTIFSLAYLLSAPIFGMIGDKFEKKTILIIGLLIFSLANFITAMSESYGIFIVARGIAGSAAAAISPSIYALIGTNAPNQRKGTWMSIAVAGFLISLTTGAPTGIYISQLSNWNTVFTVIAAASILLAILNSRIWHSSAQKTSTVAINNGSNITRKIKAVSITGIWGFCVYSLYTYLSAGLQSIGNYSSRMIGISLIVYGIGAVIGSLSGGRLSDILGAKRVAAFSLIFLSLAGLLIAFLLELPPSLRIITVLVLGFFSIVAYPCLPAYQGYLIEKFPGETGSIMAWNSSIMYLGTSLGAACGGFLFSKYGFTSIPFVSAAVGILGGIICEKIEV